VDPTRCTRCAAPLEQVPRGRAREFCTNRCRQANYRANLAANPKGDAELQAALDDATQRLEAAAHAIRHPALRRLVTSGSEAGQAIVAVARHLPH
jgi:hypothetical protein